MQKKLQPPLPEQFIIVGKLGATYGIKGWLKIISFTEPVANILNYRRWYLEEGQSWSGIQVEAGREQGKSVVAKLAGLNNPEEARLLTGKKIAVKRSELPALAKDEYYWSDLEGLSVINEKNEPLGKVIYLIATGSNDVLVVKGEKGEIAIPYLLDEIIQDINLARGEIRVKWEPI